MKFMQYTISSVSTGAPNKFITGMSIFFLKSTTSHISPSPSKRLIIHCRLLIHILSRPSDVVNQVKQVDIYSTDN